MKKRGIGELVPLFVQPGPGGSFPSPQPQNVQGPLLAPALQAFLQGFIGTNKYGAAAEDPTGLTSNAYPPPGAADMANVYGPNGPYTDDTWSNLMQQGAFSGTMPAELVGNKNPTALPVGGVWHRPTIVPDHQLPGPLKRISTLIRPRSVFTPNQFNRQIEQEAALWDFVAKHGGLKAYCRIPELGAPIYDVAPWLVQPSQGQVLQEPFSATPASLQTAGAFTGTDILIGQVRVPVGYDGVINRVVTSFTGNGFDENSGNIIWRVKAGQRFLRNLGNIQQTWGSFQNAMLVPLQGNRVVSGQYIQVYVNIPPTSPINGGVIQAGLFGWFYPRR
jgi:hypothetical protein